MSRSKSPVLPGQSRSSACQRTKGCGRLDGHRRACRATLTATKSPITVGTIVVIDGTKCRVVEVHPVVAPRAKASKPARTTTKSSYEKGVEVHSADRYTVLPERTATKSPSKASRRPKVATCRVVKAGNRCVRAYGHKQAGIRHAFANPVVKVLPTVEPTTRAQVLRTKHARTRGFVVSSKPSSRLA